VLDAGLISAAQHVEHYEMAGYGTARTWARLLGYENQAQLLQQTLDEEQATEICCSPTSPRHRSTSTPTRRRAKGNRATERGAQGTPRLTARLSDPSLGRERRPAAGALCTYQSDDPFFALHVHADDDDDSLRGRRRALRVATAHTMMLTRPLGRGRVFCS
jgi:hypothetical protein